MKRHGQNWLATRRAQAIHLWMRQRTGTYRLVRLSRLCAICENVYHIITCKYTYLLLTNVRLKCFTDWLVHHTHSPVIGQTLFAGKGFGFKCNFWALCCCYLRYPERLQKSTFMPTRHVRIFHILIGIGYILHTPSENPTGTSLQTLINKKAISVNILLLKRQGKCETNRYNKQQTGQNMQTDTHVLYVETLNWYWWLCFGLPMSHGHTANQTTHFISHVPAARMWFYP